MTLIFLGAGPDDPYRMELKHGEKKYVISAEKGETSLADGKFDAWWKIDRVAGPAANNKDNQMQLQNILNEALIAYGFNNRPDLTRTVQVDFSKTSWR